jgi:hypothetical protein
MTQNSEKFAAIFRENIRRRSRTARGEDKGSETSKAKKPLALQGGALIAKVAENRERLIAKVVEDATEWSKYGTPFGEAVRLLREKPGYFLSGYVSTEQFDPTEALRRHCEGWFDITNDGLADPEVYREEFAALQRDAERWSLTTGQEVRVNPRYRLWTPEYTTPKISPLLLEQYMNEFYRGFAQRLMYLSAYDEADKAKFASAMAFADLMMDGEIHPWIDGCGRVSTALSMFIALVGRVQPPLFAETKKEHYAAITDLQAHTAYFAAALDRGEAFVHAVP